MKKLNLIVSLICIWLCYSQSMSAQCFITTVDGKMYFSEMKELSTAKDRIVVKSGDLDVTIRKTDIMLVEYMENGIEIVQEDKIKAIAPIAFDGDIAAFIAEGKKVYVPMASSSIRNRWGAKRLRELIIDDSYWKLVGCEDEAEFILNYSFSDEGHDHARLIFSDRTGKKILTSKKVGASGWFPTKVGIESAEDLYKKYITKGIMKGVYKGFEKK